MTWLSITNKFFVKCSVCDEWVHPGDAMTWNPEDHLSLHPDCKIPKGSPWDPKPNLSKEIRSALRSDPLTKRCRPNP